MSVSVVRHRVFSLRSRLTWMLALAVFVILGGAARIVDWRSDTEMKQRFDASLLAQARAFSALVQVEDGKVGIEGGHAPVDVFPGGLNGSWYVLRCAGSVIAQTPVAPPDVAASRYPAFANARLPDGRALRIVALRFVPEGGGIGVRGADAPGCTLRYALDRGPLEDILHTLDFILLGSLFGACILVIVLTPWLVRRGLRPVAVLGHAMAGIGPETPGARLPAGDTRELAPLVARFNAVLARMDDGLARERQFAAGLAHEFRTRLAELRTLVEVETRYPSGHDVRTVLGEVGSIGAELEATVTALLQLTRIQSGLEQTRPESVVLSPLLTRACARHEDAATRRAIAIRCDVSCGPGFAMETDVALLEIVVDNLLGNAVAYAPRDTAVTLRADAAGIEVRNAAPALQVADLVNFGRRFWRKNAQGAGHAGLGLALAGAAARALRMTLAFELESGVLRARLHWGA